MSALPDTSETMEACKDSDTAAESLCSMDVVLPAQNVDVSEDATQLKASENCISADATTACHSRMITESCQSISSSADIEMQSCEGEYGQRMEVGSEENADTLRGEEDRCMLQKDVNEESTATCQPAAENNPGICKSAEDTPDTEAGSTAETGAAKAEVTDNDRAELTTDNEQSLLENNAAAGDEESSTTTPTIGMNIKSILAFLVATCVWLPAAWYSVDQQSCSMPGLVSTWIDNHFSLTLPVHPFGWT